jgi:hypothetical protein
MEADWSVELTAAGPVITVPWEAPGESFRFIDLRENPQAIDEIEEARREPALHSALLALNGAGSRIWTAKCGTWISGTGISGSQDKIDRWEMDAGPDEAEFGAGCYIDILPRDRASFAVQERWIRVLTEKLRGVELRCARIELVLRRAAVRGVAGFGVTCFVQGCGASSELAASRWAEALTRALPALMQVAPLPLRLPSE